MSRDIKKFYVYNIHFKYWIDIYIIALFIEKNSQNSIDEFQTQIAQSDLLNTIK